MDISVAERHDASVFRAIYNLSKFSRETTKTLRPSFSSITPYSSLSLVQRRQAKRVWLTNGRDCGANQQRPVANYGVTDPVFYLTSVLCLISPRALKLTGVLISP